MINNAVCEGGCAPEFLPRRNFPIKSEEREYLPGDRSGGGVGKGENVQKNLVAWSALCKPA